MTGKRKRLSAEEKAVVLRRHLVDKVPVSEVCEQYGIQPTVFYRWQKQSHVTIHGTFYYLFSVIDGYSRSIVHRDIRESMQEWEVEVILERAKEKYPEARPRIISDNGPQFLARDFREFIRISGMTHVRTSPYYPQSNGKIERWHQSLKKECIRPKTPLSLDEAKRIVAEYVEHYNHVRLHSAIGYIAPADKLAGREEKIWAERDRKLEAAREQRRQRRQAERFGAESGLDNRLAACVNQVCRVKRRRALLGSNPSRDSQAGLIRR